MSVQTVHGVGAEGESHSYGAIFEALRNDGYARYDGIDSPERFLAFARGLGTILFHRDSDASGITHVSPRPIDPNLPSQLGLTDQELTLHTDGAQNMAPPDLLLLYCHQQAEAGGTSRILPGQRLYDLLRESDPALLAKLTEPDSATFGAAGHEQRTGAIFDVHPDGLVEVRFRADSGAHYTNLDPNELKHLLSVMDAVADEFDLAQGEGYVVNNRATMHARTSFTGPRVMRRLLVRLDETSAAQGIEPGFRIPA